MQPSSVFHIEDNNFTNRQFPFLNTFPFAGNVYTEGGGLVNLPLPVTSETANNSSNTTRFQLDSFRYSIDGMHANSFVLPLIPGGGAFVEQHMITGTLNLLPNNPPYEVIYAKLGSIYYLKIS